MHVRFAIVSVFVALLLAPTSTSRAAPSRTRYDIDADLTRREATARTLLGDDVRLARVDGVFLLAGHPSMAKRDFERAVKLIEKTVVAYTNNRFATRPGRAVGVYLFPSLDPYNDYCDEHHGGCGTPYGVYFYRTRRIVMNAGPGLGTLTHELAHPFIEADFPDAPVWIGEGIASLFERPHYPRRGEITGRTNWRHPRLHRALRSRAERDKARLDRLFGMSNRRFRGTDEDLHYAMARFACQWLDEQGLLWKFYQTWRDEFPDDPTGAKAFEAVVGKRPRDAHRAWARWVGRLQS